MDAATKIKWDKKSPHEWEFKSDAVLAKLDRITGWVAPFEWRVYDLPRPKMEKWTARARGSARTLAEAKAKAEAHIPTPPRRSDAMTAALADQPVTPR